MKIAQNAEQGRRTLLICFYAGHGATKDNTTYALLNSNRRGRLAGCNQYNLEEMLNQCVKEKGGYVISLLACDRLKLPEKEKVEEANRGGTETTVVRPIEDSGQGIMIHATPEGEYACIWPETPSLA